MHQPDGQLFMRSIRSVESIVNAIMSLVSPELYTIGAEAVRKLKDGQYLKQWNECNLLWKSVFSGMQIISNRVTPPHRDPKAAKTMYDILVSAGTHKDAILYLHDIDTILHYAPCTVVAVCGRVLLHEVPDWGEGERICIAHYMRDAVHNRLGLRRPVWVSIQMYLDLMDPTFARRFREKLENVET